MRLAVISDIHANLPALEAVLADTATRDVDAVYHLGDLVGYGPWPNEVIERIRDEGIPGVAGNYDTTVAHAHPSCGCQHDDPRHHALSAESYRWTAAHTSAANRRFLASLPFRIDIRPFGGHADGPTLILLHGAATLNNVYWREDRTDRFCEEMVGLLRAREGDAVFFGHTHKPWTRAFRGRTLVNTGSVGRPKDGDPRGSYALVEVCAAGIDVTFPRVPYDVDRAVAAITASTLPTDLGTILRSGGSL
ncbi:MAG: metallophosphoesterase family protein [Gemmatimonadota bacterium]|nr:metallophosphoesterase family protein [Gemmatimonadota bacterium]